METLLTLTLSGSALALLLLVLGRLLGRRLPSTVYYYAWLLVLLRFLLPLPGLIPVGSGGTEPAQAVRPAIYALDDGEGEPGLAIQPENAPQPAPVSGTEPAQGTLPAAEPAPAPAAETRPAARGLSFDWRSPRLWLTVWALGAGSCLLWPVFSYLRFTSVLRRRLEEPEDGLLAFYAALPGRKPELSVCPGLQTPVMFGVFRPRIVLPEGLSDPVLLGNILRHELCHFRRRDPLYKGFAAAVLSLHWFNPLSWLVRRELSRACELSCDESLLRDMDRAEKQAYGETLLRMAAGEPLPAGAAANFSAKRDLKERLEQIMHHKKTKGRALAALLALALLCGCGLAAGPAGEEATLVPTEENAVRVATVDELLAAIGPHTTVILEPGEYDLSTASDYGKESANPNYAWVRVPGGEPDEPGFELQILGVEGLTLRGAGEGETTIAAVPRYANVLHFVRCADLRLEQLTAGHTQAPGLCLGGVLRFEACSRVSVDACGLYGCGTLGVDAVECTDLSISGTRIYECSYGALFLSDCRKVRMENCDVERIGTKIDNSTAVNLFQVSNCQDVTVTGCRVRDNASQKLLASLDSKNVLFLSNTVENNRFLECLLHLRRYPVTVDGCTFSGNEVLTWLFSEGVFPVDAQGAALDPQTLQIMVYQDIDPASVLPAYPAVAALELPVGGSVTVTTVDEFLQAIGPDRTILLDGELFDLSAAENYGGAGTEYYYWAERPDGPELIISGVSGLSIRAVSEDPAATTLLAAPRYANVLRFQSCEDIRLAGFTAGHSQRPGSCSGGVLYFSACHGIELDACRLYGCGTLGVDCENCTGFSARSCEIYDCTQGGVYMVNTDGVSFQSCQIHDVPSPALRFVNCGDKSWNGEPISGETFDAAADLTLIKLAGSAPRGDSPMIGSHVDPALLASGEPAYRFAETVQSQLAAGDWEALADELFFPFFVYTDQLNFIFESREDFLSADLDGILDAEFRAGIAAEPIAPFGFNDLGSNSFCGGHLALVRLLETDLSPTDVYLLQCISQHPLREPTEPFAIAGSYQGRYLSEFTLHVGDTLTLDAELYPPREQPEGRIRWSVSDESALKLTPSADGLQCELEALQAAQGGVTLTLSWRGLSQEIRVYIVG